MKQSSSLPSEVNSPEKACVWIEEKVKGHELNANTGRMWTGAIRALAEMRRDDEPTTIEFFKDNASELARRWCLANPSAGSGTGQTYASRSRAGLSNYERWLENPSGFRFESRPASEPRKRREPEPKASTPTAQPTVPANDPRREMTSIPLPGKEPFRFEEHKDLTRADVMRIMWGLMVHCADFDPMAATPPVPPSGSIVPAA